MGIFREGKARCRWFPGTSTRSRPCDTVFSSRLRSHEFGARLDSFTKFSGTTTICNDWFLRVGLTPAKSRTIGPLAVPDELFADFFRGCIDGDGSVLVYTDRYHAAKCPHYVYERLYVSLVSASRRFPAWIRESIRRATGLSGAIHNGGGRSQRSI